MGMDECGGNISKPVLELNYFDQKKISTDHWRVHCPACEDGVLLVRRDQDTFLLSEYDSCILCGQQIRYLDIDKMREMER
jgi:hypothetical protein